MVGDDTERRMSNFSSRPRFAWPSRRAKVPSSGSGRNGGGSLAEEEAAERTGRRKKMVKVWRERKDSKDCWAQQNVDLIPGPAFGPPTFITDTFPIIIIIRSSMSVADRIQNKAHSAEVGLVDGRALNVFRHTTDAMQPAKLVHPWYPSLCLLCSVLIPTHC